MRTRRQLGPSYDEEKYWDEKFKLAPDSFEWLGSGDILLEALQQAFPSNSNLPPRVLHLGAGTSQLSLDLARHFIATYKREETLSSILNVDFSQTALDIGKEQAASHGFKSMQYLRLDLRSWKELASCESICDPLLDVVLDKSTSDAICTSPDVTIGEAEGICPLIRIEDQMLDPLDLVAIHLAALSRPGCIWAVLSYSSSRFDILKSSNCISGQYWKIIQQKSIPAPSGNIDPSAPSVYHWFYLLQRQP